MERRSRSKHQPTRHSSCCGQGDVHLLDFDEWRETTHGYAVFVVGEWREVAKWQVTTNRATRTGTPLVWDPDRYSGSKSWYRLPRRVGVLLQATGFSSEWDDDCLNCWATPELGWVSFSLLAKV